MKIPWVLTKYNKWDYTMQCRWGCLHHDRHYGGWKTPKCQGPGEGPVGYRGEDERCLETECVSWPILFWCTQCLVGLNKGILKYGMPIHPIGPFWGISPKVPIHPREPWKHFLVQSWFHVHGVMTVQRYDLSNPWWIWYYMCYLRGRIKAIREYCEKHDGHTKCLGIIVFFIELNMM